MPEVELSENALEILRKRYFVRDKEGNAVEDWPGLCNRVATVVASVEKEEHRAGYQKEFFDLMYNLRFLPNSPTLFNAGRPLAQLSACFVLPIEDSMDSILSTLHKAGIIFASGGGCGYDFSHLRKKGSLVSRTNGESSGPVPFLIAYDGLTSAVKQGGMRKGANMGILRIDHPDIEEFMDVKRTEGVLANFNLSVAVTDAFVEAVVAGSDFTLYDNYKKRADKTIKAKYLFNKIVENAWSNGEPGILFLDTINKYNTVPALGPLEGTNPCSEQPLLPYESCNLGSINLASFYSIESNNIKWDKLRETVRIAIRFLDDVVDVNKLPFKEIEEATLRTRKIGLGIMGWADLLLKRGISYDTNEAIEFAKQVMEFIELNALQMSSDLAKEKGAFPAIDGYLLQDRPFSDSLREEWIQLQTSIDAHGIRNAMCTTIAPTGSLSLIANVSSAIEPNFQWEYNYHRVDKDFTFVHPLAESYLKEGKILPDYFVTALNIDPLWHVEMQAAFQKWVDNGISKTINMPPSATKENVAQAIIVAWEKGCKGITVYRTGSRATEVLTTSKPTEERTFIHPRKRPKVTTGKSYKLPVGDDCGSLYTTLNEEEGYGLCEAFIGLGKGGGCISAHVEAEGRLVSLCLRSGVDPKDIIAQLSNIRCSKMRRVDGRLVKSCPDGVALSMMEHLGILPTLQEHTNSENVVSAIHIGENPECPDCGGTLYADSRCLVCRSCGYSKCAG